jgi:hypothetical protein
MLEQTRGLRRERNCARALASEAEAGERRQVGVKCYGVLARRRGYHAGYRSGPVCQNPRRKRDPAMGAPGIEPGTSRV